MSSDSGDAGPAGLTPSRYRIEVRGLSKIYRLGELASLQKTARYITGRLTGRWQPSPRFRALSEVDFTVAAGEAFAVIGSNGSGKTTLAKIIGGITLPSSGEVITRGRVLPLLNLRAGFNSELTAIENVTMFGALLGLNRDDSRQRMPEIADFAELDREHMQTPFKRFSAGEGVRLAFATSLCLPVDVYLFDEVLNAADDSFKARCVAEIRRQLERGASAIFMSHEMPLVQAVCTRGLWLEHSRVRMTAPIDELTDAYHSHAEAHASAGRPR